ncbi:hypothetical protein FISHEDRAFT_35130 [Fistulina hepatica ATCC 64428]|uniref:UDP-N-acetylglucosamine transferase subunit ALG13 n=1 Tax=Fistulina hepatica ATCC 64428 TaxID=1128425 RepID=A0A0D7AL39_9AGAR|nr:hypothetical protein FISHEDRAFT_35130 [Fistulina hepatica ATCC 64428]
MPTVFVTVGSTKFDALITVVSSPIFHEVLQELGYTHLHVQHGTSIPQEIPEPSSLSNVSYYAYKPSLQEEYELADLVISHAGSGTILSVLRLEPSTPLIVVPNLTLADDHQRELADALADMGYLIAVNVESQNDSHNADNLARRLLNSLIDAVRSLQSQELKQFPQLEGSRFARILDEEMGFLSWYVESVHPYIFFDPE